MLRAARRRPVKDCPRIDWAGKLAVEMPARPRSLAQSRRAAATGDCVAGPLMVSPGVLLGTAPRGSSTGVSDANASTCFGTLARSLGPWVITTGRFAARAKGEIALDAAASLIVSFLMTLLEAYAPPSPCVRSAASAATRVSEAGRAGGIGISAKATAISPGCAGRGGGRGPVAA